MCTVLQIKKAKISLETKIYLQNVCIWEVVRTFFYYYSIKCTLPDGVSCLGKDAVNKTGYSGGTAQSTVNK